MVRYANAAHTLHPGIGVMNIDNGFGAAILAGKILKTANRLAHK